MKFLIVALVALAACGGRSGYGKHDPGGGAKAPSAVPGDLPAHFTARDGLVLARKEARKGDKLVFVSLHTVQMVFELTGAKPPPVLGWRAVAWNCAFQEAGSTETRIVTVSMEGLNIEIRDGKQVDRRTETRTVDFGVPLTPIPTPIRVDVGRIREVLSNTPVEVDLDRLGEVRLATWRSNGSSVVAWSVGTTKRDPAVAPTGATHLLVGVGQGDRTWQPVAWTASERSRIRFIDPRTGEVTTPRAGYRQG